MADAHSTSPRTSFGVESANLEQTLAIATAVAPLTRSGDVVALSGELGAGKTQFVRGLARGLGIDPAAVSSPTFVLMQEYEPAEAEAPVLVHIDAYRLEGEADLATLGWEGEGEAIRDSAIVAIEWAERVAPALPGDRLAIELSHTPTSRHLQFHALGGWQDRLDALHAAVHRTLQQPT